MKDQIPLFPDYKDKKPTDKTLLNDGNAGGEINPAKKSKQSKIDKAKSDAFVIKTLKKYFLKNSNDNDDLFKEELKTSLEKLLDKQESLHLWSFIYELQPRNKEYNEEDNEGCRNLSLSEFAIDVLLIALRILKDRNDLKQYEIIYVMKKFADKKIGDTMVGYLEETLGDNKKDALTKTIEIGIMGSDNEKGNDLSSLNISIWTTISQGINIEANKGLLKMIHSVDIEQFNKLDSFVMKDSHGKISVSKELYEYYEELKRDSEK